MSEVKITKTISILETIAVNSFCLGITTIIYYFINILNGKELIWKQSNLFIISGGLLLTSVIANKWANYKLKQIYKKNA